MPQQGKGSPGGPQTVHSLTAYRGQLHEGPLAHTDQAALLYGDSLFETIRLDQGQFVWLEDHLDRIQSHAELAGIPFSRAQAEADLEQLRRNAPWPIARVRLTAGCGRLNSNWQPINGLQFATAVRWAPPAIENWRHGVDCIVARNRRVNPVSQLPQMKRGNYLDCLAARRQALAAGVYEALFTDEKGNLLEGSISNLFLLMDDILITPPVGDLILPGIARARVLSAAKTIGLRTLEHPLHRDLLSHSQGVLLSNSLIGLLPVRQVQGIELPLSTWAVNLRRALGAPFDRPNE